MFLSNKRRFSLPNSKLALPVIFVLFIWVNWKVWTSRSSLNRNSQVTSGRSEAEKGRSRDLHAVWNPLGLSSRKLFRPEDTIRYDIPPAPPNSTSDWELLLPRNKGVVRLPELTGNDEEYSLTMFHQLYCLDVLREAIYQSDKHEADPNSKENPQREDPHIPRMTHHCINYLRQTVMCQARLGLESIRKGVAPKITDLTRSIYVCKDWRVVYKELESRGL